MEKYSFIDSYPKNLFSLLHIFLCGLMPSIPSRPCTPPLLLGEEGEMKLPSSLKLIDETNKSFILCPLSFILHPPHSGLMPSVPSRPRTPSPPFRRGGGVEATFVSER